MFKSRIIMEVHTHQTLRNAQNWKGMKIKTTTISNLMLKVMCLWIITKTKTMQLAMISNTIKLVLKTRFMITKRPNCPTIGITTILRTVEMTTIEINIPLTIKISTIIKMITLHTPTMTKKNSLQEMAPKPEPSNLNLTMMSSIINNSQLSIKINKIPGLKHRLALL